jgi:putative transferase (TIGR04331 family)
VKRILITTADERTWPKDKSEPVLFLGEWCKKFSRHRYWSVFNSETVKYHWSDPDKVQKDYVYLNDLYEKYLPLLAKSLNSIHGENYSLRYWRIIIGPWLGRFIGILFDRYSSISGAIENYEVCDSCILNISNNCAVPIDMHDFGYLCVRDDWNHYIYQTILKNKCDFKIKSNSRICHVKVVSSKIRRFSMSLNKLNKVNFYASNHNKNRLIKLQLTLRQVPAFDYIDRIQINCHYDEDLRKGISLNCDTDSDFENILHLLIRLQIPKSYVEAYRPIKQKNISRYPLKTKVILTAVGQSSFDDFKIWSAEQSVKGAKLIIAQHGGHYGTSPFSSDELHEIKVSDKYFSWGWGQKVKKIVSMPSSKLAGTIKPNQNGDILMIMMELPRYHYLNISMPISSQFLDYFNNLLDFSKALKPYLKKDFKIRLCPGEQYWDSRQRIVDNNLGSLIDSKKNLDKKLSKRLEGCKICIATYNATTFLETFSSNFPTLIYFDLKYWKLNSISKEFFDELESVGIMHYSMESLNEKLEQVYQNPMGWWLGGKVQTAKNNFCKKFANTSKEFNNDWKVEIQKYI